MNQDDTSQDSDLIQTLHAELLDNCIDHFSYQRVVYSRFELQDDKSELLSTPMSVIIANGDIQDLEY